jgi:hypothetical protein
MAHEMKIDVVRKLIDNYGANHYQTLMNCPPVQSNPNHQDSKAVWFSLQELKSFIHDIEAHIAAKCTDPSGMTPGIRIYFGENPKSEADCTAYGINPKYCGLHTLVMVPTYLDATTQLNTDFDPAQFSAACQPLPITNTTTGNITAMNHGETCPPFGAAHDGAVFI